MEIAQNSVASFNYTLTDDDGTVVDTSNGREPLAYLHGAGNIVPGLEAALAGRKAGDRLTVDVQPEEGYGVRHEQLVQQVPREAFQGVDDVKVGMQFQAQTQGGPLSVVVTEVGEGTVTVDGNHPLAGKVLHFDVEITEVRAASPEELQHGHVHGAGGVEH
ncbi:FKBP-type peptidyl-prolyl cis-trans isomerase [Coralloluteibacterium stylophorae]|uniref:Peptidyl-prolyl cis-trans isomerase n=1 Tax=Coralloluteibacterium stylophorae TaxID=1776034 RepID=A0A8J7VVX4_9GAMM|nr:peptidylprolyl isomerase [Coralloluteibacterium stylophorae]MBS7456080.1 peptidylprolyl isomerase [Coralloluteibacterium stylophorae]